MELAYDPAILLIGIYLRDLKTGTQTDTCTRTSTTLVTTAKRWKQPKCPSVDERVNKMWSIHTLEYYSAIKRNEALTHATIWMKSKNIMLKERSQTQMDR